MSQQVRVAAAQAEPRWLDSPAWGMQFVARYSESSMTPAPRAVAALQRFLRGVRAWMGGGFEWHATNPRYRKLTRSRAAPQRTEINHPWGGRIGCGLSARPHPIPITAVARSVTAAQTGGRG